MMTTQDPLIQVEGVAKRFQLQNAQGKEYIDALSPLSFELGRGETLGIMGQNGSGKSTLLKILSGILKPDSGQVKIYGTFAAILDLGFGMVPEFTGRENIFLAGSMAGYKKRLMRAMVEEIIDFAEIGDFIDQPVRHYSNGMYLRLAFAIKTLLQVDLLILDEIMTVGDIRFQEKCKLKIQQLLRQGASLIIVSHSLREIAEYTHRALILDHGRIVADGETMSVIDTYEARSGLKRQKEDVSVNFASDPDHCITVLDYWVSAHQAQIEEPVTASIRFRVNKPGQYDLMIYISDFSNVLLSDSFSYRVTPEYSITTEGIYECSCHVPPNFFNVGTFYVGFIISDGHSSLYENMRCLSFGVTSSYHAWIRPWSMNDKKFSLKPSFDWHMQYRSTGDKTIS
ncbi:MAG: ABC transporter ATP-binding protein [Bacteroidetes bacterium]|nr:ABC transporter ATP-binding protein [Bacteroidota bacterium]